MSVQRNLARKSGVSKAKPARKLAAIGVFSLILGLQACSFGRGEDPVVQQDAPFAREKQAAYTSVDQRVWRVNDDKPFRGLVVADEPVAADVARTILERGGNAADAATALYFSLAVTYPGAAGLGGGGSCLYYEEGRSRAQQIDFPVKRPKSGAALPIPGNVRGFAALSNKYGSMAWKYVVGPAAHLAGGDAVMSEATRNQLLAAQGKLVLPRGMAIGGRPVSLGRPYSQPGLAATLGMIEGRGAETFYNGDIAEIFVSDVGEIGPGLTRDDMRGYQVSGSDARSQRVNSMTVFTRNGPQAENALWGSLVNARGGTFAADPKAEGSTGFVVADRMGRAVACVVSLGSLFGTGQSTDTSDIYLADIGATPALGSAVIVSHAETGVTYVGASRGVSGLEKSVALVNEVVLAKSVNLNDALRQIGGDGGDAVNAIHCKEGVANRPKSCRYGTEPRSKGYGLLAE